MLMQNFGGANKEYCGIFESGLLNRRTIQMKVSDFHLHMDFLLALLATHLRMIHELGEVNQQHLAENGNGSKVLRCGWSV